MKSHPRLLARCMEPVAMTEDALRVCIAVVSDGRWFGDDRDRALADAGGFDMLGGGRAAMTVSDGVATIAIDGPLVRKAGGIEQVSGMTGYDAIRADLRAALADPAVRAIDFAVDSPGGEVSGLFELADEIHASPKPTRALVARANSAAYLLASATREIVIEQAGQAGSVGAVVAVQKPDPDGGGMIEFVSSVSPHKRPDVATDDGRAVYQRRADYLGDLLVEKVAGFRRVPVADARDRFGRGDVLHGAQAVAAGMADRIGTNTNNGAKRMDPTIFGLAADADAATVQAAAAGLVAFRRDVLAATRVSEPAAALGKLTAAVEALDALDATRAELAAERQTNRARTLRDALSSAIDGKRVTLGEVSRVVPTLLGAGRVDAIKAIEGVAQEGAALVGAICGVPLSAEAVDAVTAYLDAKQPAQIPAVKSEPAIPHGAAEAVAAEIDESSKRVADAADRVRKALDRNKTK